MPHVVRECSLGSGYIGTEARGWMTGLPGPKKCKGPVCPYGVSKRLNPQKKKSDLYSLNIKKRPKVAKRPNHFNSGKRFQKWPNSADFGLFWMPNGNPDGSEKRKLKNEILFLQQLSNVLKLRPNNKNDICSL